MSDLEAVKRMLPATPVLANTGVKHATVAEVLQVLAPPGVGELVEHHDLVAVLVDALAHEVRADEPRTTTDHEPHAAPLSFR